MSESQNKPLISIVIAAYNVEKLIGRALDSALAQTYPNTEIVVIDDCSTDNTIKVVEGYIEKHPHIRLVKCEENGGSGMAHRIGHENAKGEYVQFLDSDDWIDPTFIEDLYKGTENGAIDIVSGGLTFHNYMGDRSITVVHDHIEEGVEKVTRHFLTHVPILLNRLIRRSLFDEFPYCARRGIDDVTTIFPLLYLANKVRYIENPGYHLIQYKTSVTNSLKGVEDKLFKALAFRDYIEFFKDKGEEYSTVFHMGHYLNIAQELYNYPYPQVVECADEHPQEWAEFKEYFEKLKKQ